MYFDSLRKYLDQDIDDNTLAKEIIKVRQAIKEAEQDLAKAEKCSLDEHGNAIWLEYTRPQLQELEEEFKNRQRARRGL